MSDLQSFHQTPFHSWADTQQHLSCERLLGVLWPVIHHLLSLHAEGNAHGGITPESLVVSPETQQIDLSRFITSKVDCIAKGTPYSPPEASLEPPAAPCVRADIYSLAAVLYHALNSKPPVAAAERLARDQQLAFSSAFVTPVEQDALRQALALDANERPASIAELETLLRRPASQALQKAQPAPQRSYVHTPVKLTVPPEPPAHAVQGAPPRQGATHTPSLTHDVHRYTLRRRRRRGGGGMPPLL